MKRARTDSKPLYRSISIEEAKDIAKKGVITGRGNTFSGDTRDLVFFAYSMRSVIHSGEDPFRAVQSRPAVKASLDKTADEMKRTSDVLDDMAAERMVARYENSAMQYRDPVKRQRFIDAEKAYDTAVKKHNANVNKMTTKARSLGKTLDAQPVSSVLIEVRHPGGQIFWGDDSYNLSFQTGKAAEVGFERGSVPASSIVTVYGVKGEKVVREEQVTSSPSAAIRKVIR